MMSYKHSELTREIINAFYQVYNTLGYGFLEKVYQNALAHELTKRGYRVASNVPIEVYYDGVIMGEYFADLVVNDVVILELKAVENITEQHEAQLLNYLKATKVDVGLILNFGPKPQVAWKVHETARHIHQK
jgi:GxxExxY protein